MRTRVGTCDQLLVSWNSLPRCHPPSLTLIDLFTFSFIKTAVNWEGWPSQDFWSRVSTAKASPCACVSGLTCRDTWCFCFSQPQPSWYDVTDKPEVLEKLIYCARDQYCGTSIFSCHFPSFPFQFSFCLFVTLFHFILCVCFFSFSFRLLLA